MTKGTSLRRQIFVTSVILAAVFLGFGQTPTASNIAGGRGGSPFSDSAIPSGAIVSEVHVYSGELVDALQLLYTLPDGRTQLGLRHGGSGGRQNIFQLGSDEYIIGLSGRYGDYLDSIRIHTNKRTSPLYGGSGGNLDYRVDVASGNYAVGFTGRSGNYIDAIGLLFVPIYVPSSEAGIYGGRGGTPFSDTNIPQGARISEVRVYAGQYVDGIQAVYTLPDGRALEGPVHGGTSGGRNVFRLDSGEYIVGISGRYGDVVDSLALRTNRRTSQAFGGRGGDRNFTFQVPAGNQAIGFMGRAGRYLDAIGLNYTPIRGSYRGPQQRRFYRFRVQP